MGELVGGHQNSSNQSDEAPGTHLMQKRMIKQCKSVHRSQAALPSGYLLECFGNPPLEPGCEVRLTHKLVLGCGNEIQIPWTYLDLLDLVGILLCHSICQCGGEQIATVRYTWLGFRLINVWIVYQPILAFLVSAEITIYDLN